MNWQVILGGSLLIGSFAGGWITHGWKSDSEALLIEKAANAAQLATAEEIKKIEIKNTVIHEKLVEHTYHDPVYTECKQSPEDFEYIKGLFK